MAPRWLLRAITYHLPKFQKLVFSSLFFGSQQEEVFLEKPFSLRLWCRVHGFGWKHGFRTSAEKKTAKLGRTGWWENVRASDLYTLTEVLASTGFVSLQQGRPDKLKVHGSLLRWSFSDWFRTAWVQNWSIQCRNWALPEAPYCSQNCNVLQNSTDWTWIENDTVASYSYPFSTESKGTVFAYIIYYYNIYLNTYKKMIVVYLYDSTCALLRIKCLILLSQTFRGVLWYWPRSEPTLVRRPTTVEWLQRDLLCHLHLSLLWFLSSGPPSWQPRKALHLLV